MSTKPNERKTVNEWQFLTCKSIFLFFSIVDIEPPVISNCPADIDVITQFGAVEAVAFWIAPTAEDDSGVIVRAFNTYNPGDSFPLGTTEVLYGWEDGFGNIARCIFQVIVIAGKKCLISFIPFFSSMFLHSVHF